MKLKSKALKSKPMLATLSPSQQIQLCEVVDAVRDNPLKAYLLIEWAMPLYDLCKANLGLAKQGVQP